MVGEARSALGDGLNHQRREQLLQMKVHQHMKRYATLCVAVQS